jgi:hypothetical protein
MGTFYPPLNHLLKSSDHPINNTMNKGEFMPRRRPDTSDILSAKMLKFIAVWQGDALAAARAAGYRTPKTAACKLLNNPTIKAAIRQKQRIITEESAKRLAGQLNFDRSHVLNRLWEIAQISAKETNKTLSAQVKAAVALAAIFDAELQQIGELLPQLQTKTADEIQFFVRYGHFPSRPIDYTQPCLPEAGQSCLS